MPSHLSHAGPPYVQAVDQPGVPVQHSRPHSEPPAQPVPRPGSSVRGAIDRVRAPLALALAIVLMSTLGASTAISSTSTDAQTIDLSSASSLADGTAATTAGAGCIPPDVEASASRTGAASSGSTAAAPPAGQVAPAIRDVSLRFDFRPVKTPSGDGVNATAVLRHDRAGADPLRIRVAGKGRIWLSFAKKLGQRRPVNLGREVLVKGLRYRPGGAFSVHAEAVQRSPRSCASRSGPPATPNRTSGNSCATTSGATSGSRDLPDWAPRIRRAPPSARPPSASTTSRAAKPSTLRASPRPSASPRPTRRSPWKNSRSGPPRSP